MSNKVMEKMSVAKLSKFGFQLASGEYVNWSSKLPESEKGKVVPGGEYEFDIFVADSGKKYVNGVKGFALNPTDRVPVVKAETPKPFKKPLAKAETVAPSTMSKDEWAAKDTRISRQGVIQAAIQATGGDFEAALELAEKMLEFVNKVK